MGSNSNRSSVGGLITDVVSIAMILVPMMLAAAGITGLAYLAGRVIALPWYAWLIAAPALYLIWLIGFLATSALTCRSLGLRFPKPRYHVLQPDMERLGRGDLGLVTAGVCYRRLGIVGTLPLISVIEQTKLLRPLVYLAYAPSVHFGTNSTNLGVLYDPDLTEIGDNVVVGGRAAVVAHSMAIRPDGAMTYVSAPVKIGNRATIGGEARVALGCSIGEDAIVEPGAVVGPFTHIPAGEVWGGNPATFRRLRDDVERRVVVDRPAEPSSVTSNGRREVRQAVPAELRQMVLDALDLTEDEAPEELSSQRCASWDSLGQIAIAAAIFDRYGVTVDEQQVYRLRTMRDVADAIAGRPLATPEPEIAPNGACDAPAALDVAEDVLPDDLDLLPLLDPQVATRALATHFGRADDGDPLRVVVAASFTAQPLATALTLWGRAFGYELDCRFAEYDQIVQTLLDERGSFARNRDGVNVVLTRLEDLATGTDEQAAAQIDQTLDAVRRFTTSGTGRGQLLVGTLPPVVSAYSEIDRATAESLRHRWLTRLKEIPGVELLDFAGLVERLGVAAARNSGSEVLLRAPYSARLYQELGIALVRQIRAKRRASAKVIAVDCDNTLWGGVVGEVGPDGIQLGPDGPGRGFQLFQRQLKRLKERGILLAVVSKNEARDVREVFEHHPEMILRPDDIVAWQVNWNHKSENLRELAADLNLGIDSFVFLDDDPAVRLEVHSRLPEVHVVPLPANPVDYCDTLNRLWLFDGAQATAEDAKRTRMMQEEGRRKLEQKTSASLEEFLASLELRVEMGEPSEREWPRVAQLTQKTNQFNLSLKRRTLEEVKALGSEASVLVLKVSDRFGDYGLVGVAILQPARQPDAWEIDTLLMSCRALGRGAEDAILYGMAEMAARNGATTLLAPFVDGPRNAQVKEFLIRSRFTEVEPNLWALPLAGLPSLPAHIELQRPGSVAMARRG